MDELEKVLVTLKRRRQLVDALFEVEKQRELVLGRHGITDMKELRKQTELTIDGNFLKDIKIAVDKEKVKVVKDIVRELNG